MKRTAALYYQKLCFTWGHHLDILCSCVDQRGTSTEEADRVIQIRFIYIRNRGEAGLNRGTK